MRKPKVYIDGQAGTTGLQIVERLKHRDDIELLQIDEALRKDEAARKQMFEQADLAFLCLPDAAAIEAVQLAEGTGTKIIDASTAHRTTWTYGFPELSDAHRREIQTAQRVANPGCHATGLTAIVYPLVQSGLVSPDEVVHAFSLTGYSGGGNKMIAEYESRKSHPLFSPRIYGLNMDHKHLPEMQKICGLNNEPLFTPIVDDYYNGMLVSVQLEQEPQTVYETLSAAYAGKPLIQVEMVKEPMLAANAQADTDELKIYVGGSKKKTIVTASFDNLGKGACGAAIQNMNLMLGLDEFEGLRKKEG